MMEEKAGKKARGEKFPLAFSPAGSRIRKKQCGGGRNMGQTGDTETREMRCAGCDKLCRLRLTLRNGQLEEVSGQGCGTGAEYAAKEILME